MVENKKEYFPAWIKAKQNGSLGEARTRAFLLDRFWILERSIDIDGVDFIIQRRITNKNILDKDPPKFGVIQVKYFENEKTTHYIHKEYIVDNNNNPRMDFFITCHTGHEEFSKMYLITPNEIVNDFSLSVIDGIEKYRIPGTQLFKNHQYEIINRKNSLDRIENQLKCSNFVANRQFISWNLESSKIDIDAVLPVYKEPMDNWWGDIPSTFRDIKEVSRKAAIRVGYIYEKLKSISEEIDPMKAFEIIDDIRYECYGGGHWSISLPDNLSNNDFEYVCRYHLQAVENLKRDGLLDKFINVRINLNKEVSDYLCANYPIDVNMVHCIRIKYSLDDYAINSINQSLIKADEYWSINPVLNKFGLIEPPNHECIKEISDEEFEFYWLPGRYKIKDDPNNYYANTDFFLYYECMSHMLNKKYLT